MQLILYGATDGLILYGVSDIAKSIAVWLQLEILATSSIYSNACNRNKYIIMNDMRYWTWWEKEKN